MGAVSPAMAGTGFDPTEASESWPLEISPKDRRNHARVAAYWASLRTGGRLPAFQSFDTLELSDLSANSLLLAVVGLGQDAEICFIGDALREIDGSDPPAMLRSAPGESLLSGLLDVVKEAVTTGRPATAQYSIASSAGTRCCTATLLPLTSMGSWSDYVYGVITTEALLEPILAPPQESDPDLDHASPAGLEAPTAEDSVLQLDENMQLARPAFDSRVFQDSEMNWPDFPYKLPGDTIDLAIRLDRARSRAERHERANVRSRSALYEALSEAYDFALAAEADPDAYSALLDQAGLSVQDRAPMTPVVKLVFGLDYDKTRLTEFAAALSWARRRNIAAGGLLPTIKAEGGLKPLVRAEREARRPGATANGPARRLEQLRTAPAIACCALEVSGDEDLLLLIARREKPGEISVLKVIADRNLLDRAAARAK